MKVRTRPTDLVPPPAGTHRVGSSRTPAGPWNVVVSGADTPLGRSLLAALGDQPDPPGVVRLAASRLPSRSQLTWALTNARVLVDFADVAANPINVDLRQHSIQRTRRLVAVAEQAALGHLVLVSSSGQGRDSESEHFTARLAAERIIELSSVPHTILRTAPICEELQPLALTRAHWGPLRGHVPVRPVTMGQVAAAIAALAAGPADGTVRSVLGPDVVPLEEAVYTCGLDHRPGRPPARRRGRTLC